MREIKDVVLETLFGEAQYSREKEYDAIREEQKQIKKLPDGFKPGTKGRQAFNYHLWNRLRKEGKVR